ncbi:uncharacterized protein TNCV_2914521 [Trichonephila clavipes]|nr:uncharacterized protein TNCV_2914521 [Trichonephila clavipes]
MPKFEGPYRVLEVWNNNLIIWKKGKRVTVNIDQLRVYHPRQSDTISLDNHVETLYEGQRSSNGSSRSHPGKSKRSRKTSSEESKGRKSNKGNAGLEDPRLKRKGSQSIAGPSHQIDTRQGKPPTEGSRQGARGQYDRARKTRTTTSGGNRAAERRSFRFNTGDSSETFSLLPPTEPSKTARRNTRGAEKQWNRQYPVEQPQEKEPQHGSVTWRSGG